MTDEKRASLPDDASLEWLRKHAKQRLRELRTTTPDAKLADAQLQVARAYGFTSWRALKAHIDTLSVEGQLFAAAKSGDLKTLRRILDANSALRDVRAKPYEHSLLHAAAQHGQLAIVEHLIGLGIDVNYREKGDNTVAMHWAAATGNLAVVRALADAGSDVIGHGDDHAMEIIGWACMWDGADDEAHRQVVEFLLSRGARHHIFSAIAMDLPDEVRRIVRENPKALEQRRSHNESFETTLHYAVGRRNRAMVQLLLELGADYHAHNEQGYTAAINAMTPGADEPILERYRDNSEAAPSTRLFACVALHDWHGAEAILRTHAAEDILATRFGSLHLMSKRGDAQGVKWLLDHGADANGIWSHYGAMVTPLHMASWGGHSGVAKALLDVGADATIKDSMHDSDALGWAEFFGRMDVVRLLRDRGLQSPP
jgi:ankyrin repeat protein